MNMLVVFFVLFIVVLLLVHLWESSDVFKGIVLISMILIPIISLVWMVAAIINHIMG